MPELPPHIVLSSDEIAPLMKAVGALADIADRLHTAATSDGAHVTAEVTLNVPDIVQLTLKR
jgi:hypothetical protein